MKHKFFALLLALAMVLGLIPAAMAATDSNGRYAENCKDYLHAYVVKGEVLQVEFRYNTVSAPCASPVWLYKADLTGNETQEELDALGRKLLKSGTEPLYFSEGFTHSVSSNRQYDYIETADLKTGTYLIVAAAMSDTRFIRDDGRTTVHYDTATGVGLHVVEEAVPIERYEVWYCDADGRELRQLSETESFIISHENDTPLYHFKVKTFPANATERVVGLNVSPSAEEYLNHTMIPGVTFENGMYSTCAQHCGSGYFWMQVAGFGGEETARRICCGLPFEIPCHPDGPVKVQQWYSCTEPGFKCSYCHGYGSTCETVFGYEILDPPGHQLKEIYEITLQPTATQPGLAKGLCKNCLGSWVEGKIPAIFTDTQPDAFYSAALDHCYAAGWVTGMSENTFSPTGQCLRAQVVTFLWRAEGCPEPETTVNPFVDVTESDFYYKAVLWAVEKGITTGADAAHFNPMGVCNRAQVVTFLHRAKGSPAPGGLELPFTDVPAEEWFAAPVAWALENGITNGISATEFGPNSACNRAQVVTFLYRASDK